MSDWVEMELGEALTLQRGFDLPKRVRNPGPYPVVSSSGVTGSHSEFKVNPPGVVIGRYGSLGSVHWVTEPFWPLNTGLWVKDFKENDPRFVSFLLETVAMDGSTAAAVPGVNRNHLHKLIVRLPCLATQHRVAAVLSAIDDLIEVSKRRVQLLETSVRAVHRRFKGASQAEVDEIAVLVRESTNPAGDPGTTFEHFSIPAYDNGQLPTRELGSKIKSAKFRIRRSSVLLSKLNPRIPRVWMAQPQDPNAVASSEFLVWEGRAVSNAWLWCQFLDDSFRGMLVGSAQGTSTSHQRISPQDVKRARIDVPPRSALEEFDAFALPALDLAADLRMHSEYLLGVRDLLLPPLVTGRLDISDVELGILTPTESE